MSDHKYVSKSGYPTFWNHIIDSVEYKQDKMSRPMYTNAFEDPLLKNKQPEHRCLCSNCEAHIGFVYNDGPLPFNKRFQVNDAAITFEPKPWFKLPELSKETVNKVKKHMKITKAGNDKFIHLIHEEKKWSLPSYENRVKREKYLVTKKKNAKKARTPPKKSQEKKTEKKVEFDIKGETKKVEV